MRLPFLVATAFATWVTFFALEASAMPRADAIRVSSVRVMVSRPFAMTTDAESVAVSLKKVS